MIRLELNRKKKEITVEEPSNVTSLQNGFYGNMKKGVIYLSPAEALYVMDIRNGKAYDEAGNIYSFNETSQPIRKHGNEDRIAAPCHSDPLGGIEVVPFIFTFTEHPFINIYHCGGSKCVEFSCC